MRSTKLGGHLFQLTRFGAINAYLVREADGFTLIDTTLGGAADGLIAAAAAAGGEIKRIALTHGHGDHVGSLDALKARLGSTVQISMGELDARILAGETVVEGKLPGSWPNVKTVPDTRLVGGERIGSLEVVATPGHSPGHVAFRDIRDGAVIAGDVFTSFGGVAVSNHFHFRFPFAAMATWDGGKDLESARVVRALNPSLLVVGHGPATPLPAAAMDAAITRAQR
ncbi:MAG: MBL fold metallo-hydrolase [Hyphomicrobiales bacterium]|nr:MBL fold metallo-hydrolase [Hyphomicrobiales bacterium]MBV9052099.1 MBL fold metallo-hydrolase [Hyphomicrobiales bacterium]MBV9588443.1 MBL fold metallo-hydrolase [Hyphomicrobiales bacterium]MBV9975064.1 MBL fold metallo-hydrolase [Hyphomicrobiales bacterium]